MREWGVCKAKVRVRRGDGVRWTARRQGPGGKGQTAGSKRQGPGGRVQVARARR